MNSKLSIWAPFCLASLATLLAQKTLWDIGPYWQLLSLLAAISVICAIRILAKTGLRPLAIGGVVLGLVAGQGWLIEMGAVQFAWGMRGFAP